jgi:hypothetical protein
MEYKHTILLREVNIPKIFSVEWLISVVRVMRVYDQILVEEPAVVTEMWHSILNDCRKIRGYCVRSGHGRLFSHALEVIISSSMIKAPINSSYGFEFKTTTVKFKIRLHMLYMDAYGLFRLWVYDVWCPLWREGGSVAEYFFWPSPA